MSEKVLYLDKVYEEFKQLLYQHKPDSLDLVFWDELTDDERFDLLPNVEYLLVATTEINKELLEKAKNVKFIQKTGIGVDNIDVSAAVDLKIPISNTPRANASGVAELTILHILALYRKLPILNEATKEGKWLMWEYRPTSFEMNGKTHGFIGFGNIGQETAKRSKAFGTNILYYDAFQINKEKEEELAASYAPLDTVLRESDIISLHLPLLPETKGLISTREFSLMKESAILINVSRGGIVDELALSQALETGEIAGAGIDVWDDEPPKADHPLLQLENVTATPHIGAGTRDTLNRVLQMAFTNIKHVQSGNDPAYVVNSVNKARSITEV